MNKHFFSIFIFLLGMHSISNSTFLNGVGLGGYWELTPKYYPKTVTYFDTLKNKYPDLASTPIIILDGPMADWNTIYFPMKWIEELEKGNKFYIEATEWIVLHELGHIAHYDVIKAASSIALFYTFLNMGKKDHNQYRFEQTDTELYTAGMLLSGLAYLYCNFTREYYADDYAMKHCDNPAAWIAAYEFLDRQAPLGFLPGIAHSFTTYRLSRIAKAFKAKFGYDLEVVPQSITPQYLW